jgi:oxygen-dependent protoporphyrinogen oxidase
MPRIAIIGAGISGLCTAHYLVRELSAAQRDAEILILEAEETPGGKMRTVRQDGFNMEWGPNGFLTNKPYSLDLVRELGAEGRLAVSSDLARKRFIFSGGTLHRLPESPPAFLKSKLMTTSGKLRIFMEPFAKPLSRLVEDETLADFARRRLGPEALEKLLDPMVTGIFCGDPERMSLKSCFPTIHEMEMKYGSLVKAMLAKRQEKRRKGVKQEMSAGPGGVLTSFDDGTQVLVDLLAGALADGLHTGVTVDRVERQEGRYRLSVTERGKQDEIFADAVVVSTPAYAASALLSPLDASLADALAAIPYAPISVVALGYDKATLENPLDGFGFLIPRKESRKILGALWDSSVFPNRAPQGKALLRAMVGGVRAPELASMPANELVRIVRQEFRDIMGIAAEPLLGRVFFHEKGIPQYFVGHGKLLERMDAALAAFPGLYLNSNAYRGVSLNDCVLQSRLAAQRLCKELV